MIKQFLFVEDGSIDVEEIRDIISEDIKLVIYRQGSPMPTLVPFSVKECITTSSTLVTKKSLNDMSWLEIKTLLKNNDTSMLNAGDTKSVKLKDGQVIDIQILGFNHDIINSKKKAPITFRFKNLFGTDKDGGCAMNASGSNCDSPDMNKYLTKIFDLLPDELQELIIPVKKKTASRNGMIVENTEKLFLPSEVEIYGETTYSAKGEGKQYELFKDWHNRVMGYSDSTYGRHWWERSAYSDYGSDAFCGVYTSGDASISGAYYCYGVAPCFAVGI